ncbi:MAG TPA: response regulator [Steroidobacteraceae bacterium]|nr:response regulator [Steroidobacteraceae bacterium]
MNLLHAAVDGLIRAAKRQNNTRYASAQGMTATTRAPRILVVEDQYFVALDCEQQLAAAGFDCVGVATTAASALDLAEREKPDLIVMDVRMSSNADGVEAAIVIYERFGIRCIFATGHADENIRREAARARPLGWVEKPYSADRLIAQIYRGLEEVGATVDVAAPRSMYVPTFH